MLQFAYWRIQLKQISWRQYLNSDNPLAAALLSQLDCQPSERLQVKLEFLRLLTQMELISVFFERYLKLSAEEELGLPRFSGHP